MTYESWRASAGALSRQLARRGIRDPRVLDAIAATPRHQFVPEELLDQAYVDTALPIGSGQTISQPYIVAMMTEAAALQASDVVLEIGTGSGYQAAILSQLARHVVTLERLPELANAARERLTRLGYRNLDFETDDGTLGWPAAAPYDAILVTAAAPDVPQPLKQQLREGGRLVIPVGGESFQELLCYRRYGGQLIASKLCDCRFVKLIGAAGWADELDEDPPTPRIPAT